MLLVIRYTLRTGSLSVPSPSLQDIYLLSYDPYGPAGNLVGKPYKKNPVWGPNASSDRDGKTRAALLKKRTDRCWFAPSEQFQKTQRSCDRILIDWVRSGRKVKYLALGQDARTSPCFPARPSSLYFSGKLPTFPSPKPTFCQKWEVSVNVGWGEG